MRGAGREARLRQPRRGEPTQARQRFQQRQYQDRPLHDETQAENDAARKERAGVTPSVDAAGIRSLTSAGPHTAVVPRCRLMPFPHYQQEHPLSCGIANICMLAHWCTEKPQSKLAWKRRLGFDPKIGSTLPIVRYGFRTLRQMGLIKPSPVAPDAINLEEIDPHKLVYVLFIDWYETEQGRPRNWRHWITVHQLDKVRNPRCTQVVTFQDSTRPRKEGTKLAPWSAIKPLIGNAFRIQYTGPE